MHEEQLHGEHAVDERAEDAVQEDARVVGPEPEDEDAVEGDRQRAQDRQAARPAVDPVDVGRSMRTTRCSFPKMRPPVSTWITAKTSAALANHALPAMPVENTEVIRS